VFQSLFLSVMRITEFVSFDIIFHFRKLMLIMMAGFCQRISEKRWSSKRVILRKWYLH